MPEFVPLAESIVDAILRSDPGLATFTGDHRFDDRMPDLSPGAVSERVAMLRDAADALSGIDPEAFGPEDQVDHAIDCRRLRVGYGVSQTVYSVTVGAIAHAAIRQQQLNRRTNQPEVRWCEHHRNAGISTHVDCRDRQILQVKEVDNIRSPVTDEVS